jgi:hypothetical protein
VRRIAFYLKIIRYISTVVEVVIYTMALNRADLGELVYMKR